MPFSDRPHNQVEGPSEGMALSPRRGGRSLRVEGVTWSVYEDRSPSIGPSLIFESDKIARRVRDYPVNWRELSDVQLFGLSWSR